MEIKKGVVVLLGGGEGAQCMFWLLEVSFSRFSVRNGHEFGIKNVSCFVILVLRTNRPFSKNWLKGKRVEK